MRGVLLLSGKTYGKNLTIISTWTTSIWKILHESNGTWMWQPLHKYFTSLVTPGMEREYRTVTHLKLGRAARCAQLTAVEFSPMYSAPSSLNLNYAAAYWFIQRGAFFKRTYLPLHRCWTLRIYVGHH